MSPILQDLRYGVRNLLHAPAFTLTAILALTLGIGATTAIFSLVNGVVLKPLPYGNPDRLVSIWDANHARALEHEPLSPVTFLDYRGLTQVFQDAAAWWRPEVNLRDPERDPLGSTRSRSAAISCRSSAFVPSSAPGFRTGYFSRPTEWHSSATGCGNRASAATTGSSAG